MGSQITIQPLSTENTYRQVKVTSVFLLSLVIKLIYFLRERKESYLKTCKCKPGFSGLDKDISSMLLDSP